jgi:EAL and modified HD-GYP domain-containing signal transduction protein
MFLFGMLSLIEPMLEIPIKNILDELPLADEIKSGYIDGDSTYGKFLQLVVALEYGDSVGIDKLCQELGISQNAVAGASNRAIAWTTTMSQSMN